MNWDQIKGNWEQVSGKAQQQWGKQTNDDFDTPAMPPAVFGGTGASKFCR